MPYFVKGGYQLYYICFSDAGLLKSVKKKALFPLNLWKTIQKYLVALKSALLWYFGGLPYFLD